jgi:CRP-like cAMP-binding protein
MEELPHKLRLELAMEIHKHMYENVTFFKDKDKAFIAWIGVVIRPLNIQEQEYICKEGEEIIEIYFLVKGKAGYVLPRYDNRPYFWIEKGSHFGHIDLFGTRKITDSLLMKKKKKIYARRFTLQALSNIEILTLSVTELEKMRLEFPHIYK